MYANILIATDGSELAGKAVQDGIALAKRIGAKVVVLTVSPPFRFQPHFLLVKSRHDYSSLVDRR